MGRVEIVVRGAAQLGAAIAGALLVALAPARAASVPVGFQESLHVLLSAPSAIAFDPGGGLWITQHTGQTSGRVWRFDGFQTRLVLTLPTSEIGERGIHAIEIDPDFPTNQHVWVYYTAPGPPVRNRLSRFAFAGGVLVGETIMLEGPAVEADHHNGGCLAFAPDGTLYLGMGDDSGDSPVAQNPSDLRGKILRIRRDGTAPPDPPWPQGDARVWAIGARNPYRCRVHPESGTLLWADVGSFRYEELNVGLRGANFGWATAEGFFNPGVAGLTYPIHAYPSRLLDGTGAAIIGGDFAGPSDFAPEYEGDYFFADWVRNEIRRMVLDESLQPVSVTPFVTNVQRPTDLRFGPDGALYYVVRSGGVPGVWRLAYDGSTNRVPVALATAAPAAGLSPLTVEFDGVESYDPDESPLTHQWDFGDTTGSSGVSVSHSYPTGVYEARLTVTDAAGGTSTSAPLRVVSGNEGPVAALAAPAPGSRYDAGQVIAYSGSASDPEDGALPCASFTWQVLFHHNDHVHPYLGPVQGHCSGSFATATRGETETNVWYEVRLSVEDSGQPVGPGAELSRAESVDVLPNVATITIATAPHDDFTVTLDSTPATAPLGAPSVVGLLRSIGAPDGQPRDGRSWSWIDWSDGGTREHEVAAPTGGATYTATFGCNAITEVLNLVLRRQPGGALRMTWDDVDDSCNPPSGPLYRIYAASTPRPTVKPGQFPVDPAFQLVATTPTPLFDHAPTAGNEYFLVVAVGSDRRDGPAGAY